MNYRHAYHAGNIGDVLKHAVLARLVVYLQRKDKPFRILDTHAGIGQYDLASEETKKTGEWSLGIGKIMDARPPLEVAKLLTPWLDVVKAQNPDGRLLRYPGSPALARALMRSSDRLTLTELHPSDFETLAALFEGDHHVKTIHLDGWLALGSFLPPKEKRGLVIIDPAFEVTDEFERISFNLCKAWKKWQNGIYAVWYPLKDRRAVRKFHSSLDVAGVRNVLALELNTGRSTVDSAMLGSGMTVINPPYTLADEMNTLLPWFTEVLVQGPGANWWVNQLIEE